MPRQQIQKSENQFAILMDNKYMKATINPYPTIGGGATNNKKNIGDWGNKNVDIYKAPQKINSTAVEEISVPIVKNPIVIPVKKSLLAPRSLQTEENFNEEIDIAYSDEE